MLLNSPSSSTVSLRNCCRCGDEFHIEGTALLCQSCRMSRQPRQGQHLTPREKQIVVLVRAAKLNKEIAFELHLTEGTVKEHLNRIFRKLDVRNRTELALWSLNHPDACRPIRASAEDDYLQVN